MKPKPKTSLYFTTVAASPGTAVVVGGHLVLEAADPTATVLLRYEGGTWKLVDKIDEIVYGLAVNTRIPCVGVLGRDGYFSEIPSTPHAARRTIPISRKDTTYLEDIAYVGEHWYVCGGSRQVYRLDTDGWSSIDSDMYVPYTDVPENFLLSIDGFSDEEIYVCGSGGFVARWDGRLWHVLDSPTNLDLNAVLCTTGRQIYFCGAGGTLLYIDINGVWHDLSDDSVSDQSLWNMAEFQDRVYVAAGSLVLRTDGTNYERVAVPAEEEPSIYALSANNTLWCVGDELLYENDGSVWTFHVCPANT